MLITPNPTAQQKFLESTEKNLCQIDRKATQRERKKKKAQRTTGKKHQIERSSKERSQIKRGLSSARHIELYRCFNMLFFSLFYLCFNSFRIEYLKQSWTTLTSKRR